MPHPLGELVLAVPAESREAADDPALATLETALTERDIAHRRVVLPTGHAVAETLRQELARDARLVVVCGGQRAFCDVAAAVVDGSLDLVVGTFAGGRSHDLARTFGLDVPARTAALLLASDRVMSVDVGVATVTSPGASPARHLVFNEAVVGLGAEVYRRQSKLGRVPRVGPLSAWWTALASYRPRHLDVDMTFAEWHDPAVQVRIANGQFAHDGLHVSPLALPDDGAWDVQVWDGPVHLPFTLQPKMRLGEHLPHEHIAQWRQKRVEVTSAKPTAVAVDGRYVGRTPATFELRPGALRLKI